jgi:hypothetical protein
VRACVCVGGRTGSRAREREREMELRAAGGTSCASAVWCRGGGGWTQAHAGPRQTGRDRVPAAAGVRCGRAMHGPVLLLDAVRIRCSWARAILAFCRVQIKVYRINEAYMHIYDDAEQMKRVCLCADIRTEHDVCMYSFSCSVGVEDDDDGEEEEEIYA